MEAIALMLIFAAGAAVYAGVTGRDVLGQVREVLGGYPSAGGRTSPFAGSDPVAVKGQGKQSLTADDGGASSSSGGSSGSSGTNKLTEGLAAGRGALGPIMTTASPRGPIPVKPSGTVPDASDLDLVAIGQGSHKLTRAAAASFAAVEAAVGRQVKVTDSYRTHAQEQELAARKPGYGVPGYSLHEVGLAVDIVEMTAVDIVNAFNADGWVRWSPTKEPWHWSYWLRG